MKAELEILDFEPAHAADFERLNREWLERWFEVEAIDAAVLGDPEGHIIAGGGSILMARQDGRIAGTVALKHQGGGSYELTKMAVTAGLQGRGIGSALLRAAIARFHELRGERLYLESHDSLASALSLYENAGFVHQPRPAPSSYARGNVYMVFEPERKCRKNKEKLSRAPHGAKKSDKTRK